jgi:DNA-binding MarR family transcriptional regulator
MSTIDDGRVPIRTPPSLACYTGFLLRRAYLRVLEHSQSFVGQGRHPREFGILIALTEQGPLSQRQLGELLGVNRTIMVNAADRLEADGLLSRERDPADRRSYALHITAAGKTAFAEMSRAADRVEATLTAALTAAQRRRLLALLGSIVPDVPPRVPKKLAEHYGFLISHAHRRLRAESESALRDLGIAPRHFGLLTILATIEPCSQQCVAGALGISGPAVVQTMNTLETGHLITRQRNPADRRERLFRLTSQGRERLAEHIGHAEMRELNALLITFIS